MKILKWTMTAFILALLIPRVSRAQTHFIFTSNTGNNATVGVPLSSNPNIEGAPLSNGDEIGAFTPEGLCVGAAVWNGANSAITVWGDNDQTQTVDGIKSGEQIHYRVWKKSTNVEYANVAVTYSQGDGIYAADKIFVLSTLTASSSTDTVVHHFIFTSNTGNNATVGIPVSANPNIDGTPLSNGDEIGGFTPAGLCVGGVVWNGANTAMTVWGDNDQTAAIDGIKSGEQIYYRVWRKSDSTEFSNVAVTYSQGNGVYAADNIFVLSSLSASSKTTTIPTKPTLLSPPNGAINQPTSVTLIWSSSSSATTYHLQLSTDSTFATVAVNDSSITDITRIVSGLSNSTSYFWRVSAKNSSGSSQYSGAFKFTTAGVLSGPVHFIFTINTGNNATVGIPSSASPTVDSVPLASGDEIGAFTPEGLCVGAVVWNGTSTALTVWGDNDQTSAVDGIKAGELIQYRVWQKAINREDTNVTVTYSQGDGIYGADKIFVVSSLNASSTEGTSPTESELVAYYPFQGNADDSSGNGNNGTIYGSPTLVNGIVGKAWQFGGIDNPSHIVVPNSSSLAFSDTFTISFWFNILNYKCMDNYGGVSYDGFGGAHCLIQKSCDVNGLTFVANRSPIDSLLHVHMENGKTNGIGETVPGPAPGPGFKLGQWVFVVATLGNGRVRFYQDGVLIADTTEAWFNLNLSTATNDIYIGENSCNFYPLNGTMDEIRIYRGVLSANEITALYDSSAPAQTQLTWTTRAPMPISRSWAPAVQYGGKIYVIGGCSSSQAQQFQNAVSNLAVYDPNTDSWTELSPMPVARVAPVAVALNGNIYVMGGFDPSYYWSADPTVEIYNIATNSWSTGTSMPTGCSWASGVALNGKIYVLGGVGTDYFNLMQVFDQSTNSWSIGPPFVGGRYLCAATTYNGKIYLIGGDSWETGSDTVYDDLQVYDPTTNSWTSKTHMPSPASGLSAVTVGTEIYVFGDPLARKYDIASDTWQELTSNQNNAGAFTVCVLGNSIYRFGGGGWGPTTNIVQSVDLSTTPVKQTQGVVPSVFVLFQNYPNPFNPSTTISFDIPKRSQVRLVVYDVLGREVKTLVDGDKPAGSYQVTFDASGLPSGVYFYRLTSGSFAATKKLMVVK